MHPDRDTVRCLALAIFALLACPLTAHALTHAGAVDNIAYYPVQNLGYSGSGVVTAVVDTAFALSTHQTFYTAADCATSRVTWQALYGGTNGAGGHPTAVAGVIVGRGNAAGQYVGIAPQAELWSASVDGGTETTIHQAFYDFSAPGAHNGKSCQIFAMSLAGAAPDSGQYSLSMFMDWMASSRNSLIALPAGNYGNYIWVPGGNFNQITVDGLDPSGLHWDSVLAHGPTPDGRSKPDILAPSAQIWLPGLDPVPSDFYLNPGPFTSVATPFVTGVAALVRNYGDAHSWAWDQRVAKAVILNGATKLKGWTHTSTAPLDVDQGAGRLNAEWTLYNYAAGQQAPGSVARRGWDLNPMKGNQTRTYTFSLASDCGDIISATLDWWRYCVQQNGDPTRTDNWIAYTIKDLNLYLYNSAGQIVAQSVSTVDPIEHIFYKVASRDTYHLFVNMNGGHSYDCETYALAWNTLVPGDANGDGKVDGQDLAIWQEHYDPMGLIDNIWTYGDWNGDGRVDGADLALWAQFYDPIGAGMGQPLTGLQVQSMVDLSAYPGASDYLTGVPEPATLTLLGLGALALAARRRVHRLL